MSRLPQPPTRRWQGTGVFGLLEAAAAARPAAVYLEDRSGRSLRFAETENQARRLATHLAAAGVRRGDRVAVFVRNRIEAVVALYATALLGGIFVVVNARLRPKGLSAILNQCGPAAVVADGETRGTLDECELSGPPPARIGIGFDGSGWVPWDRSVAGEVFAGSWTGCDVDAACLVFTSGSTGTPRGVALSHDNIAYVVDAIQDRLRYRPTDVVGGFLPLAFDYGLYQIFLAAQAGAKLYLGDPDQVGPRLPRILRQAEVTVLPGVPSVYAALIALGRRKPLDLPRLRAATNTGERLPAAHIGELRQLLPELEIFVMYGLTECKRVSILLPGELANHGDTVGRALSGTEVYAVDPEGVRLPPGETGELVVRGRHVALGYWEAPEETARRFRKRSPASAVELFTGDTGSVDGEGFIRFSARNDEWIKHRSHRISPLEIETEACQIAGVVEASLLQREADDTLHLFVTASDPAPDPEAIRRILAGALEPVKVPDRILRLEAMPRSLNGKIDRRALASLLAT